MTNTQSRQFKQINLYKRRLYNRRREEILKDIKPTLSKNINKSKNSYMGRKYERKDIIMYTGGKQHKVLHDR